MQETVENYLKKGEKSWFYFLALYLRVNKTYFLNPANSTYEEFINSMARQQLAKTFPALEKEKTSLQKYRIEIRMIKPYQIVDFWPKKPETDNILEAFIDELFTLDSSEYFKIKVSKSHDQSPE